MLTVTMLAIVLAITTPAVSMFFDVNNDVQQTYLATNQVVLASEVLTQYLHEAIAPCPANTSVSTCSTTAFSSSPTTPTNTSLTFYADVNFANGPAMIVLQASGTTFTANEYLPTGGCPVNGATNTSCTYPSLTKPSHVIVSVSNLTNVSNTTNDPVLSYDTTTGSNTCNTTSTSSVSSITAVCIGFQTSLKGGLAGGYQATAFALASSYNGSVG